jgi:hypothetical protein
MLAVERAEYGGYTTVAELLRPLLVPPFLPSHASSEGHQVGVA